VSAIPLLVFGPDIYRQWFELIAADRERAFFLTNASLSGLAARVGLPALGIILSIGLLVGLAAWAFLRRPDVVRASGLAVLAALLASPLGWIHYTLFLLPVLLAHWSRPAMRLVALLLVVPVPFVIGQFTQPALVQLTIGSAYAWALVLCLAVLLFDEWRLGRPTGRAVAAAVQPPPAAPQGEPALLSQTERFTISPGEGRTT
jgi:hypothetical protein